MLIAAGRVLQKAIASGISCGLSLQPAHDARQFPSCRYHPNCAQLLRGSQDIDNSGFYMGMAWLLWIFYRLPLSGMDCQRRKDVLARVSRPSETGTLPRNGMRGDCGSPYGQKTQPSRKPLCLRVLWGTARSFFLAADRQTIIPAASTLHAASGEA
jgi:hypothetical protein